ncbi:MAG: hypothetical protein H5U13_00305, partial [Parvibaculum sp.]|nr:hypothetical protein [Parvibaculum sp.]
MKILKRAAAVAVILMGATACSDSNEYVQEAVTGPSPFHGIHGITVTKDGKILAGSVVGRAIYEVDPESGTASIYEASPAGMADDLEEGPDGTLAWTEDGRLFATQVFLGDTLYELDPAGENPPRKIMAGMGGLNGFDFGPDGKLYGPLWFKKQIVRVDVDSGTDVATGLDGPAMLKLAGDGALYVSENTGGRISRVDIETGERSVVGRAIYEVDPESGTASIYEASPAGMADDLEEGPDGTLAWTAFLDGKVYARKPGGELLTLAEGLPGLNSLAWMEDGRLFATQVFLGDALYELDPTGENPPRKIMAGMGGLNGFDFGPDGKLYGPLWFKKQIVRVDVDTGTLDVIAEGFATPAAVN